MENEGGQRRQLDRELLVDASGSLLCSVRVNQRGQVGRGKSARKQSEAEKKRCRHLGVPCISSREAAGRIVGDVPSALSVAPVIAALLTIQHLLGTFN